MILGSSVDQEGQDASNHISSGKGATEIRKRRIDTLKCTVHVRLVVDMMDCEISSTRCWNASSSGPRNRTCVTRDDKVSRQSRKSTSGSRPVSWDGRSHYTPSSFLSPCRSPVLSDCFVRSSSRCTSVSGPPTHAGVKAHHQLAAYAPIAEHRQ
jgi:hypothetical protein